MSRDDTSDAFDFEKIASIYFYFTTLEKLGCKSGRLKLGSDINKNTEEDSGDVDVTLYCNDKPYCLQIKSNKNLSNITLRRCKEGAIQLFNFYRSTKKGRKENTKYILLFEGNSTVNDVKNMSKDCPPFSSLEEWCKLIVPEINEEERKEDVKLFINHFRVYTLPSREEIKKIFESANFAILNQILGELTKKREVELEEYRKHNNMSLQSYSEEREDYNKSRNSLLREIYAIAHTSKAELAKEPIEDAIKKIRIEKGWGNNINYHMKFISLEKFNLYSRNGEWIDADWKGACEYQKKEAHAIMNKDARIVYFGSANVCMAIHLGWLFGRHTLVTFMQSQRKHPRKLTWGWSNTDIPKGWSVNTTENLTNLVKDKEEVAISLLQSGTVLESDVRIHIDSNTPIIEIAVPEPTIYDLENEQQMDEFIKEVIEVLKQCRHCRIIHLFPAIPSPVALLLGQQIVNTMFPLIKIYEYSYQSEPKYLFAITLSNTEYSQ